MIAGRAGEGISACGYIFGKACARQGLHVFEYGEYPSLIRGGYTSSKVSVGVESVFCQAETTDLLVALNEDALRKSISHLASDGMIILDPDVLNIDLVQDEALGKVKVLRLPMVKIAREATGQSLAADVVSLAACAFILGLEFDHLKKVVAEYFAKKGEQVVKVNLQALDAGLEFARANWGEMKRTLPKSGKPNLFLTGSEAIGLGALGAGVKYFAAYPMTPTSNLMHFLAGQQEDYHVVVKHAEDEISAINSCIGASFAGVRSMTASAGGGFALMVEGVSLAAIAEVPLVVVVGGRPGPATGLPTWTSQTDLQYVMHSGHGEFPRIVFTPGNLEESLKLTRLAFILAEKYHTQSYIISDKFLLESRATLSEINPDYINARYSLAPSPLPQDDSYRRFLVNKQGYSPRSIPGQLHGLQLTNSYEHDEYGLATEDAALSRAMVEKRLAKWEGILKEVPPPILLGPKNAPTTLVCWGSTRLVVEEVLRRVNVEGEVLNAIHILTMLPFKKEEFVNLASQAKKLIMVEGNALHQGAQHIYSQTGIKIGHHINRYDGRPFYADEVIKMINDAITQ